MSSGNLENDHGRILNNIKFKRVLITGITGLLGSWLAEELMKKNVEVLGISLDNEKDDLLISKKIYSNLDIQYFDIANEEMVSNYFKNYKYPWLNVENIEERDFVIFRTIHIVLKDPGTFGKRITFVASRRKFNAFIKENPHLFEQFA